MFIVFSHFTCISYKYYSLHRCEWHYSALLSLHTTTILVVFISDHIDSNNIFDRSFWFRFLLYFRSIDRAMICKCIFMTIYAIFDKIYLAKFNRLISFPIIGWLCYPKRMILIVFSKSTNILFILHTKSLSTPNIS